MRFAISAVVAAACVVLSVTSSHARGPYGSITIGNWQGGAYTDDNSGNFTHCAAGASYQSGIYFLVLIDARGNWRLGFSHQGWRLTAGESFPMTLTFDGEQPFNVYGRPLGAQLVAVDMPLNSSLINQFRKARTMSAFAEGQLFQFDLNQTAQLLPALVTCVESVRKNGLANAGEFAVAPPKQAAAPSTAAPAQPSAAPPKQAKPVNKTGTGFVVSGNGHIVTNNHVISGCDEINGNLGGEAPIKLRLVSSDETNDLALLQAPSPFKEVATIREYSVQTGDGVIAIGYPYHGLLTSDFTVTTGIVSSMSGMFNDTRFLQISAAVQPGNSGGPLLDFTGALVGVVSGKLDAIKVAQATGNIPENINFAIKTGALKDFLDNSAVAYRVTTQRDPNKETAEIAKAARGYTLLISCTASESARAKKAAR
ncbi:trypsin-like peptidase domain-containing protein [Bradyrhizobium sp. Arg237L]|uniref:S1C family serine protease n=1 Tax=Bradyrhizobium sp. Arg237L TaxID=3003352 RepID=UPI00249DBB7E|nr:trypsin-like peptidase domain-containing protein [Bradyrhizobium sp. Arg237L]MDI4233597.1 trypsin-like peptidase domain-containing protein [Bradyrhizobium sp. Arg237L]